MSLGHGASIVRSNLCSIFDSANTKSYSGSGTSWSDLVRQTSYADTIVTGAGTETWMGGASTGITISVVLLKIGTVVGYAEHPISKWVDTTDASFVLYHFGTTGTTNLLMWYGNRGGLWGSISAGFTGQNGSTYAITLQYNNTTGGQLWVNGAKVGSRTASGARATSTASLKIFGPTGSSTAAVKNCYMWNRELTDAEILSNFEAIRGRYGI